MENRNKLKIYIAITGIALVIGVYGLIVKPVLEYKEKHGTVTISETKSKVTANQLESMDCSAKLDYLQKTYAISKNHFSTVLLKSLIDGMNNDYGAGVDVEIRSTAGLSSAFLKEKMNNKKGSKVAEMTLFEVK